MALIDRRAGLLVAAGAASLWLTVASSAALACGGFFPPAQQSAGEDARRPSLAYEQTLIVFDADRGKQHFIREVTFRGTPSTFGFVVPAPTRPTVAAVKTSPFADLRESFPFERPEPTRGGGLLRIGAGSTGAAGSSPGVTVIEKREVGSFTAFVLAANDRKALSKWLRDNGFTSTREADAWLAKYVPLGFYYVAMRYRPSADDASDAVHAETMRVSFDTPVPYYPYQEPESETRDDAQPRLAELWLVSQRAFVPVASRGHAGKNRWVRPFRAGYSYKGADRGVLASALAEAKALLPKGRLQVQRFMDQKERRPGFGDVVFVPQDKQPFTDETTAQVRRMLPPATDPTALLSGEIEAKTFPEIATESGVSFDPNLRDVIAPVRRSDWDGRPDGTVQLDGVESNGDVDPGEITVALKKVRYQMHNCFRRLLERNPTIETERLHVRFELDASGTAVHVEAPGTPELLECVRLGVGKAHFPAPKSGPASVTATVTFRRR